MRRDNQQTLKEVIDKMLKAYRLDHKFNEAEIRSVWEKIMEPAIVKRTSNIRLQNKRLYIAVSSDPLREELVFLREKIKKRINDEVGKPVVEDIFIM